MEFVKTLPELARHEYSIDYATGNFTLKITDYAQQDILKNFVIQREYNSLANRWKFNIDGRPQKLTLQTLREIFFIYEGKNLISVRDELGRITRYDYDENFLTCVTYPDRSQAKYIYDAYNKLAKCIEGGKILFQNEYDEFGRLIKISDANGTRNFFYDDKNRQTIESGRDDITYKWTRRKLIEKIFYADGTTESFIYDANCRLNYKLSRNGDEFVWRYHKDFLAREILPDGMIISYEYDNGNLIRKVDSDGREEIFSYSSKNLLIEKKVRLNVKDWRIEKFERDMAGRILTHDINGQITSYAYDEESPVPSMIKTPCGYKFSCFYDKVYRLLEIKTEVGEFFFSHTPMNKIVAEQKNIFAPIEKPEKFSEDADIKIFDNGDRLIEARQKIGDKFKLIRWKYDLNDNCIERREWLDLQTIESATGRVKVTQYEYDAQNRLTFEFDGENVAKYYYDCLNNLTRERKGKFKWS